MKDRVAKEGVSSLLTGWLETSGYHPLKSSICVEHAPGRMDDFALGDAHFRCPLAECGCISEPDFFFFF